MQRARRGQADPCRVRQSLVELAGTCRVRQTHAKPEDPFCVRQCQAEPGRARQTQTVSGREPGKAKQSEAEPKRDICSQV